MGRDADRRLLMTIANDPEYEDDARENAAKRYREIFGEDVPTQEGPVQEGLPRMGPPGRTPASDPGAPTAAPAQASPPWEDEWDKRVELVGERLSNVLTAGASRPVMDLVSSWLPPQWRGSSPQRRQELAAAHPGLATGADVGGGLLSAWMGPARLLDQSIRAGIGAAARIIPAGAGMAPEAAAAMANTAPVRMVASSTSGVAENAAQNLSEGRPLLENAGVAAGVGAGGQLLGEAAGGAADLVNRDRWIGGYSRANRAGVYDQKGFPEDPQLAAEKAEEEFAKRNARLEDESQARLAATRAGDLQTPIPRKNLRQQIQDRINANLDGIPAPGWPTGRPKDPQLHEALDSLMEDLDLRRLVGRNPQTGKTSVIPDPTYETMIIKRAAEHKAGAHGSPTPTDAQMKARTRGAVMNEVIKPSIPKRSRRAEAQAHANANARREERDIVYNSEANVNRGDADEPDLRVSKEKAAQRFFRRAGDTNVPGLENRKYHKKIREAAGGEYVDLLDMVEAAKAREMTRPTVFPEMPGSGQYQDAGKWAGFGPTAIQLLRAGTARLAEPALQYGRTAIPTATTRLVPLLTDPVAAVLEGRKKKEKKK